MTKTHSTEMPTTEEMLHGVQFTLYKCPDFTIVGTLFPRGQLHIHAKWDGDYMTPSLLRKAQDAVELIKDGAAKAGVDGIYTIVPKHLIKWEKLLGFEVLEEWTNNLDPEENLFLMGQLTEAA